MNDNQKKSNIRSFRFSNNIMEMIEAQEGKSFSDKLSNLIYASHEMLPKLNKQIQEKKQEIQKLDKMIKEKRNNVLSCINKMETHLAISKRWVELIYQDIPNLENDSRT